MKRIVREYDGIITLDESTGLFGVESDMREVVGLSNVLGEYRGKHVHLRVEVTPVNAAGFRWTRTTDEDGATYYNGRPANAARHSDPVRCEVYGDACGVWTWRVFDEHERGVERGYAPTKARAKRVAEECFAARFCK